MTEIDPTLQTHRRNFLKGAGFVGAGVAAGALAGGVAGAAVSDGGGGSRTRLTIEVACLGHTVRVLPYPALSGILDMFGSLDQFDVRGSPWWVEGWIYPAGTITGYGFIPVEEDRIGSWFCRGHFLASPDRPDPHLSTMQEYYFGGLEQDPMGSKTLASQGVEGRNTEDWSATRVVTGGTGVYRGARGEVTQTQISRNSTAMPGEDGGNAPNFRFDFDIDLP